MLSQTIRKSLQIQENLFPKSVAICSETSDNNVKENNVMVAENAAGEYNGRKYRVKWSGQTKFGHRTNLEFFDGSKNFWVDTNKVKMVAASPSSSGRGERSAPEGRRCDYCGSRSCSRAWNPRDLCDED
jgi:hypothetical protein